ncbi:MAG: site-specific tyrosine recombinase XerD [Acidimicrobiia bacterium]|nr:site-specific tyrosine recombinase XerD [Acidimicrobiia bacterium]
MAAAPSVTLDEGIPEFLAALASERGLAANTLMAYRRDLSAYRSFLEARGVHEPAGDDVAAFVAALHEQGLATATIARRLAAVRGLHRFLVAEELADEDPTLLVETPRRGAALPKALTVDEATRLVEAPDVSTGLGVRDRALLEFLYATGARVSEAVAMELTDLDLEESTALVTGKGSKQRLVPIGRHAIAALERYLPVRVDLRGDRSDPGAVFLNARGGALSRQGVYQIVRKYARVADIDPRRVSPHVLRHSAATHMVEGGGDLRTIQEILGHASISTTQIYTRVSPRHLLEVYVTSHPRSR